MASRYREAIGPAYLFLCLILGGSAQGIWQNMVLQLFGLSILAWAASPGAGQPVIGPARQLLVVAVLASVLVAIQMVPLPPAIWTHLGGRGMIADGYHILGIAPSWLPLSVTPYRSFDSLLGLIPPLALFAAIVSLRAYRATWLIAALLIGTIASVVLGTLQVTGSGNIADSPWYLYAESSYGLATGFFANANHMANLLVCTLPFLAALLVSARGLAAQRKSALIVSLAAATLLIVVGIALNHSLAVYGLTPPVLAASALILLPQRSSWRRWWAIGTGLLVVLAVVGLATTSVRTGQLRNDARSSAQSREEMLVTSAKAMRDFLPWGSGLGSFRSVYQLYEDPAQVTDTYVPHAHNDYVELALEMGLLGVVLIIAFLAWWARAVWRAWRHPDRGPFARAATIASGAILLHSVVDFPLRTATLSALFAMCLAMLVERPRSIARSRSDLRPTRHVVIK
jgi:O-antigen ligase